jgi:hypothetical protein
VNYTVLSSVKRFTRVGRVDDSVNGDFTDKLDVEGFAAGGEGARGRSKRKRR